MEAVSIIYINTYFSLDQHVPAVPNPVWAVTVGRRERIYPPTQT